MLCNYFWTHNQWSYQSPWQCNSRQCPSGKREKSVDQKNVHYSLFVVLEVSLVADRPLLQFSPSSNCVLVGCSFSFFASARSLGFKKLGWLVEDKSLAHILSVIITLFCLSIIRCKIRIHRCFSKNHYTSDIKSLNLWKHKAWIRKK